MNKRLIRQMPLVEAKEEWIKLSNQLKHTNVKYLMCAEVIEVEDENLLVINIFSKSEPTSVAYRVVMGDSDYITQEFSTDGMKWRTGSLDYLIGWDRYYNNIIENCVVVDTNTEKVLKEFLNVTEVSVKDICNKQERIKAIRLQNKHQVIKDEIDKKMEGIKELPKNFDKWIENEAMYHSRYIYYKYEPKKILEGYCTHCKKDVVIEGAKHNKMGVCPNCKSPIQYKSMGKSRNIIDYGQAALMQRVGNEIIVRQFKITKNYSCDYRKPELVFRELARDFYNGKSAKYYEWASFKQTNDVRWCENKDVYDFSETVLYTRNLNRVLKGTRWEYSAIGRYANHQKGFGFPVYNYMRRYLELPALEYLVKAKLFSLTTQILTHSNHMLGSINIKATNFLEFLNINRDQFKTVVELNAGISELTVIREIGKANLTLTDEQIVFVTEYVRVKRIVELSKYTTVHRMLEYAKQQSISLEKLDDTFNTWVDYIKDCKLLKYDLNNEFVLFPRNLREAHKETNELIIEHKNELYNERIGEMYPQLSSIYNWEYKDHTIMVPKSYDEIIKEGHSLRHCVARNYAPKVIDGESVILFLRNKDNIDKPYYTIEVDPKTFDIVQVKGFDNKEIKKGDEVDKIINRYKSFISISHYRQAV